MVGPAAIRAAVAHLEAKTGMSERQAYSIVGRGPEDDPLQDWTAWKYRTRDQGMPMPTLFNTRVERCDQYYQDVGDNAGKNDCLLSGASRI